MKTGPIEDTRSPELQAASKEKARANNRLHRATAELTVFRNASKATQRTLWKAVADAQSAYDEACASFNHLKKIEAEKGAPRSVPSALTGEPILLRVS